MADVPLPSDPTLTSVVVDGVETTIQTDVQNDPLSVQEDSPLDVSAETVTVQEDSPLDVSAETVTVDEQGEGPFHDRVTAAATNASINPGAHGQPATIVADVSGQAVLTVGVSNDGSSWSEYTVDIADDAGVKEEVSGFAHVRASVDSNLNSLAISAKGV